MNAMQILSSVPWVERLGWTLVHFLWQGLSIAVLYAAARRAVGRTSSPQARYLLACAALAAMMAAPLATWGLMRPLSDASPDAAYRIRSAPPAAFTTGIAAPAASPASVRATVSGVRSQRFLPWVVMVWFFGAAAFWVRLMGGWVVAARMRSVLVRRAPPEWQETLRELGARIGLSRPVRLLVSALVQVPAAVGWLRPVVLVPVGALSGLPAEHLEALLLHELAHIRRHDYLVNILQSVAEALLFYHPAVWWVSGHIRAERELCCDDVAVSVSGDALTYARALAQLESYRPAHLGAAIAANGGSLADRIARLLGQSRPAVRTGLGPGVLAVAILLVAAAYGLFGQSDPHPAFQSVSIKRNTSNWSERFQHPMSMSANASLMLLIQFTYAPHDNPMNGHSLNLPVFSGGRRSGLDQFRGLRYRGQTGGQHRSEADMADVANAPGRPVQAQASSGDKRATHLRFDGGKEWPQTAGGEGSGLRFFSARHAAAIHPGQGRLWLCLGPLRRVRGRAATHKREQGSHSGPHKGAYIGTGPAGLG